MSTTKKTSGIFIAVACYAFWGLTALYWKQLTGVSALQILCHRILWAAFFCLIVLFARGKFKAFAAVFADKKKLLFMVLVSVLITSNWGIYIAAVTINRVLESALGYYMTPILSIVFGALFFREKMDFWTVLAVCFATAGILVAVVMYGTVPWIAILLSLTFSFYGVLKKKLGMNPLIGLAVETCIAVPFAMIVLVYLHSTGQGSFIVAGARISFLLFFAGLITALPLLLFARAANSIPMQWLGFIQYISPTLQATLGLFVFKEKIDPSLMAAFCGVIAAALTYSVTRFTTAHLIVSGE